MTSRMFTSSTSAATRRRASRIFLKVQAVPLEGPVQLLWRHRGWMAFSRTPLNFKRKPRCHRNDESVGPGSSPSTVADRELSSSSTLTGQAHERPTQWSAVVLFGFVSFFCFFYDRMAGFHSEPCAGDPESSEGILRTETTRTF